jgi:Replication protein
MLSIDLHSASTAPSIVDRINTDKIEAVRLAELMPSKYRIRMQSCCDWLSVRKFSNGYQKLNRFSFCRVRGCPLCDNGARIKITGKICHTIAMRKKEYPLAGVVVLHIPSGLCAPSEIKTTFQSHARLIGKICKRKVMPQRWARFMSIEMEGSAYRISGTLLLCVTPGHFSGKNYIGTKRWEELIGCHVTKRQYKYSADRCMNEVVAVIKSSFMDLTAFPESDLKVLLEQSHNQRFRDFSQHFFVEPLKPKALAPSTKARLSNSTSQFMVFAPDVVDRNFEIDRYLQVEDFDLSVIHSLSTAKPLG